MKNIFRNRIIFTIIGTLIIMSGCKLRNDNSSIHLLVAASLTDVLGDIQTAFQDQNDCQLNLSFASSGTLVRQLENGAPADVYLSASKQWMDYADSNQLILDSTRVTVAFNRLVLIKHGLNNDIDSLSISTVLESSFERLAIGDPEHVPAGKYAVSALQSMGHYEQLKSKFIPTKSVRSALMMVELDACDYGIVYLTDALKSDKVSVVGEFPYESYPQIEYHAAMVNCKEQSPLVEKFFRFFKSAEADSIWIAHGFIVNEQ